MRKFSFLLLLLATTNLHAQKSEDFIPVDAVTVFSINNFALLQKVSLDELVHYDFMQEIQAELFDGSTSGKTIKESGIDFNQKLNVYYGQTEDYEVSGFSFGITDINQLFTVFDDFDKQESPFGDVDFYSSYFNHLIVKGDVGVLLRVEPLGKNVDQIVDSIWYARGYSYQERYNNEYDDYYEEGYEEMPDVQIYDEDAAAVDRMEESTVEIYDVESAIEEIEEGVYEEEIVDISHKNYSELRDSVFTELNQQYLMKICNELFVSGKNLKKMDKVLAEQLTHDVEGVFYLDNSRNLTKTQPFWYYQQIMPSLVAEITNLYSDNKIVGDIQLNENSIVANMTANYGESLGKIYQDLNSSKFDKNITKYIHKDNSAYFTYNVDLHAAYDRTYDIIMPILRNEKSRRVSSAVLAIEMINAFVDKDAVFDTYKGSMFGTFNGVKQIPVRRLVYEYDEDFNYTETETFEEEDIPIFTLGFSTKRNDIPTIFMEQMANMNSEWQNMGKYWKIENAVLESVPLYVINRNDMFIMTNDENLAVNHADGYGADKISKKQIKETKKSGFVYSKVNWEKTLEHFPKRFLGEDEQEMLNALRTKTGGMTLTSSKTTVNKTEFQLLYDFKGEYEDPGKYVLDMINSLYVIMK